MCHITAYLMVRYVVKMREVEVWADCINWSAFCKDCVASSCIRTVAPFVASFQRSSTTTVKGKVKHMYVCEGVARRRSVGCLSRYSAVTSSDDVTDWGRTIQNNCNAAAVFVGRVGHGVPGVGVIRMETSNKDKCKCEERENLLLTQGWKWWNGPFPSEFVQKLFQFDVSA